MAADKKKGKKGAVSGEIVAQLRAFEATYKAACKRHVTIIHKPLLLSLQEHLELGTPCDKVVLTGDTVDAASLHAVMDCLAGYPAVQNLCCWACNLGDEGLLALCALLKASCDKWWKGSKLRMLEITNDGFRASRSCTASSQPTCSNQSHLACAKAGTIAASTMTATHSSRPATAFGASSSFLSHSCARPSTAGPALTSDRASLMPEAPDAVDPWEAPAGSFGAPGGLLGTHFGHWAPSSSQLALGQQQLRERSQPLPARPGALNTSLELRSGMMLGTMHEWAKHQQQQRLPVRHSWEGVLQSWQEQEGRQQAHGLQQQLQPPKQQKQQKKKQQKQQPGQPAPASGQPQQPQQQQTEQQQSQQNQTLQEQPPQPKQPASFSSQNQQQQPHQQQQTAAGSQYQHPGPNAQHCIPQTIATPDGSLPAVPGPQQPRFGLPVLQELSLTLGAQGLALQVLCLDGCCLGDPGMDRMAAGLARCISMRCLSLQHCGIGAPGAMALAASLPPLLQSLRLSGNAIGGAGLQALVTGLRDSPAGATLTELQLADIGVTDGDATPLQRLAYGLMDGICPQLQELNFDRNFIGDHSAAQFLSLLPRKPTLKVLRLTNAIDRGLMENIKQLLDANIAAGKRRSGNGAKKKKAIK